MREHDTQRFQEEKWFRIAQGLPPMYDEPLIEIGVSQYPPEHCHAIAGYQADVTTLIASSHGVEP